VSWLGFAGGLQVSACAAEIFFCERWPGVWANKFSALAFFFYLSTVNILIGFCSDPIRRNFLMGFFVGGCRCALGFSFKWGDKIRGFATPLTWVGGSLGELPAATCALNGPGRQAAGAG